MSVLRLTGAERQSWLQGMVTNDVEKLRPGESCYAGHLTAQGKLVAQMTVLAGTDELWLLVEKVSASKLAAAFDKLIIMEDVQVLDASEDWEILGLTGPNAESILKAAEPARVIHGELGYDLILPRASSQQVIQSLVSAGAAVIDFETWNVLRTEAGLPVYGLDLDETTTLPELGGRGISYDKGCYIGQEVVARIKYIGHVNRRFVGFVCDTMPKVGVVVQRQGKDVGSITTAVFSPSLGKSIALGFVSRTAAEPGTEVQLMDEPAISARVASLPFVPTPSWG